MVDFRYPFPLKDPGLGETKEVDDERTSEPEELDANKEEAPKVMDEQVKENREDNLGSDSNAAKEES
jgi:hypothetical protein